MWWTFYKKKTTVLLIFMIFECNKIITVFFKYKGPFDFDLNTVTPFLYAYMHVFVFKNDWVNRCKQNW